MDLMEGRDRDMNLTEFINKIIEKCHKEGSAVEAFVNSIEISCTICPLREKCQKAEDETNCSEFLIRELSVK